MLALAYKPLGKKHYWEFQVGGKRALPVWRYPASPQDVKQAIDGWFYDIGSELDKKGLAAVEKARKLRIKKEQPPLPLRTKTTKQRRSGRVFTAITKNPKSIDWFKSASGGYIGRSGDFQYFINKSSAGNWLAYVSCSQWGQHVGPFPIESEDDAGSLYEIKDICDDFNRLSEKGKLKSLGIGSHAPQSSISKADTRTLYNLYRKLSNAEFRRRQTETEEDLYWTRLRVAKELEKRGWFGNDIMSPSDSGRKTGSLKQLRGNGGSRWPKF
jgi:hypothetical protein